MTHPNVAQASAATKSAEPRTALALHDGGELL
jgi:hypothetical protein